MNGRSDYTGEMPRTPPLDERGIEAMLAGDDSQIELSAFITAVRHAADGPMPAPSTELRELFARGFSTQQQESPAAAGKWRIMKSNTKKWIAGLSLGGKIALGVGVAAAATTGAGSAGVLPGSMQHEFAQTFDGVLPFEVPDPGNANGPYLGAAKVDPILIDSLPTSTTLTGLVSTTLSTTTAPPATVPTTVPPTTVPPTTAPPATVPTATVPPTTVPPATAPSTTLPTTAFTLKCQRSENWISVLCTWVGTNPPAMNNFFLVKTASNGTELQRDWIGPDERSYIDVHATVGETYSYKLVAENTSHQQVASSNTVSVTIVAL